MSETLNHIDTPDDDSFDPGWDSFASLYPEQIEEHDDRDVNRGVGRYEQATRKLYRERFGDMDKRLSLEEELGLAEAIQAGLSASDILVTSLKLERVEQERLTKVALEGRNARNYIVEAHLRFATYLAKRSMNFPSSANENEVFKSKQRTFVDRTTLAHQHAELADRIQTANEGLIQAADTFKPLVSEKSGTLVRFATHAAWAIDNALYKARFNEEHNGIRLPVSHIYDPSAGKRFTHEWTESDNGMKLDRSMKRAYLADLRSGLTDQRETELDDGVAEYSLEDVISDPYASTVEELVEGRERDKAIIAMIEELPEREYETIGLRWGILDEPWTLDQIGDRWTVTNQRIRQITMKAMTSLSNWTIRHPSMQDYLRGDIGYDVAGLSRTKVSLAFANIAVTDTLIHSHPVDTHQTNPQEYAVESGEQEQLSRSNQPSDWRLSLDEAFDAPVRTTTAPAPSEKIKPSEVMDEKTYDKLLIRLNTSLHEFDQDDSREMYPSKLAAEVLKDKKVTTAMVERLWHETVGEWSGRKHDNERVSLFFSHLIRERIKESETVTIMIPDDVKGLDRFGAALAQGRLVVNGNLGRGAGFGLNGVAEMVINGNVGSFAFEYARGSAVGKINGLSGGKLAFAAQGQVSIEIPSYDGTIETAPGFDGTVKVDGVDISRVKN